jgi:MoaA/NifB/PqqE/SkfB family radical SAM enzyme
MTATGRGALPENIDWQVTYACQLRCTHCYTESGRRASRKLPREKLLQIADKLVAMKVRNVLLGGGEPLLVPEIFEIAERLAAGGVRIIFYTNGIELTEERARRLAALDPQFHLSLDGATADVHDAIRGREGSFEASIRAITLVDRIAGERRRRGERPLRFGFDIVLVRSNFSHIEKFCAELAPRFPELTFIQMGAVIPSGLATRESFAEHEVLTPEQIALINDPEFSARMERAAPRALEFVRITDNISLQYHSINARGGENPYANVMEIEPDGTVRGMVTYEGAVGHILEDAPEDLWQRCADRVNHPFVVEQLSAVKTPVEWAAAVRRIDEHFSSGRDLVRLRRRSAYVPGAAPVGSV